MKVRTLIKKGIDNIIKYEKANNSKEVEKWITFLVKADKAYNTLWKEEDYQSETYMLEKASEIEKTDKKLAEKLLEYTEIIEKKLKESKV